MLWIFEALYGSNVFEEAGNGSDTSGLADNMGH